MYMQLYEVINHTIIPFSHSFGNQPPENELKKTKEINEPLDKHKTKPVTNKLLFIIVAGIHIVSSSA